MTASELRRLSATVTPENATELERISRRFGAQNCWTGPIGKAAGELLAAVRAVKQPHSERF